MRYKLLFQMVDESKLVALQEQTDQFTLKSQSFDDNNKTLQISVAHGGGDQKATHTFTLLHSQKTDRTPRKKFNFFVFYDNGGDNLEMLIEHTLVVPLEKIFSRKVIDEILKNKSSCQVLQLQHMIEDSDPLYSSEVFKSIKDADTIFLNQTE